MKRIFILFLLFLGAFAHTTKAQSNCEQNLKQAEDLFNSGDYENCIQILEKSLKECNFSSKKKEDAFELLVKSYLDQDNLIKADAAVHDLLKNNPHYELKETDSHEDFDILVNKFDVHPLFTFGITNSVFIPEFKITNTYSILENVDYTAPYKTPSTVLLYYPWFEYEFVKSLSFKAEVISFKMNYDRNFSKKTGWIMTYREDFSFVEVPLLVKKYLPIGKNILPYATLGMGYLRMLSAKGTSYLEDKHENAFTGEKTDYSYYNENIDMLKMREKNSFELTAGAGIGYKFKNLGIFIDAKYCRGINSLTIAENRFSNTELTNYYFYIDNSVKLNKYEVGISISYTLKNLIKKVR